MHVERRSIARALGLVLGGSTLLVAMTPARQGPPPPTPVALPGATAAERNAFLSGAAAFREAEGPLDGLGPVFNGVSCLQCHQAGGLGGAATDLNISRVTRIGGMRNGRYDDLVNLGGPVLQARSLREFNRNYPFPGETVPREATFTSRRLTTPLFGAGLIEAIPDATILALERQSRPDGVHGFANRVRNPETGREEIGRFGWKSQVSTLHWFSGDAYLNEMGVTSQFFPNENLPQGRAIPRGADPVIDPEDGDGDVAEFTTFMRFLAPLRPEPPTGNAILGERVFDTVRCTSCHVPSLRTGPNRSAALNNVEVRLYSDLLLHSMGPGLADGIQQGNAKGDQFRTAPLWGVSKRPFLLHDGRARTVDQAIQAHAGESTPIIDRYRRLTPRDRSALLEFLQGL